MKTHHILLRFGDNDFAHTLRAFGDLLVQTYERDPVVAEILTAEHVTELWNRLSPGLYLLAQNRFAYRDIEQTARYLQITSDRVLVGDAACAYVVENAGGMANHDWLFVTLMPYNGSYVEII